MTKILDRFEKVIKLICAILFIGIMILMAAQVFSRYLFGHAIPWSEHASRALFIWMIMLYAGVLVRNSGNIGFDLLAKALPAVVSDIFALICDAGIVAFSAYWGINAVKLCEELGLCDRVIFNSFDAYVLEYIYKTYGRKYLLHGYYPYDIMSHVELDPAEYLDYACYWSSGEGAKRKCGELKALGIEPCTGSNTKEADFYEAASYGCGMFTENDPKSALAWREFL